MESNNKNTSSSLTPSPINLTVSPDQVQYVLNEMFKTQWQGVFNTTWYEKFNTYKQDGELLKMASDQGLQVMIMYNLLGDSDVIVLFQDAGNMNTLSFSNIRRTIANVNPSKWEMIRGTEKDESEEVHRYSLEFPKSGAARVKSMRESIKEHVSNHISGGLCACCAQNHANSKRVGLKKVFGKKN